MASTINKVKTGEKRRRTTLSIADKIEIVQKLEKGVNRNVLMQEYNVGSSTLYDIKHSKNKLLDFASTYETNKVIIGRKNLRKPKFDTLDKKLYEWFSLKRSEGIPITGAMLIAKAKDFKKEMNITEECAFSDGWLTAFKLRHGIKKLHVSGEKKSTEKYKDKFEQLIMDNRLTSDAVHSSDNTRLHWKCLPLDRISTLDGANEKDQLTVLSCADATDDDKLQLLVIGKYARQRGFKGVPHLPVIHKTHKNARTDKENIKEWIAVDKEIKVAPSFSDQEIIDSVDNLENPTESSSDCEEDVQEKVSWTAAEQCMQTVLKFLKQNVNFSEQDVMYAYALYNIMITKTRQASFK